MTTCITYSRVSTQEQRERGYSLRQQHEALREYCQREGWQIADEITDGGQSGASLERPGLDHVRDLVAQGGVDVVLAQDRDRLAREPAYLFLLRQEFAQHGTVLRALNDRGDDSPEGELTDGILDQLAKFERAKTAERTRRGKIRKAREGKIVGAMARPTYGFRFNATRDAYVVVEEKMAVVRRIFEMVGEEGVSIHGVQRALEGDGVTAPRGGRRWSRKTIVEIVGNDAYRPHTTEELEGLGVAPGVVAGLDPAKSYGVNWWGKRRTSVRQVAEDGPEGRRYLRRQEAVKKDRSEWIAVPVPDAGVPPGLVDAARERVKNNPRFSSAGHRVWELSGLFFCGECGKRMAMDRRRNSTDATRFYNYYRCQTRQQEGLDACPHKKNHRAEEVEEAVWAFVSELVTTPARIEEALDREIERLRKGTTGDPEAEAKAIAERFSELDNQRLRAQDVAVEGLLDRDELRARLVALEDDRKALEGRLAEVAGRRERVEDLEMLKAELFLRYMYEGPELLYHWPPEKRHALYGQLRTRVVAQPDGTLEVGLSGQECVAIEHTSRYARPAGATSRACDGSAKVLCSPTLRTPPP
ncbi:MAG: recombinase family protein [Rubrobacter sp.]|nr:recombinase family protein [Rubrobacter sp.]MDQ3639166.1 recombinase family protein [Actinomycetota bacterium]